MVNDNLPKKNLQDVLKDLEQASTQSGRKEALTAFRAFFNRANEVSNINKLGDKAWHAIFEVVFKFALTEKHAYLKTDKARTKTAAFTQLTGCADSIKILVRTGAPKIKGKTVEAIVDHITQTLPTNDGGYCGPLVNDYLKALIDLFKQQENTELLKREVWSDTINFCIEGITQYVDDADTQLPGFSRSLSSLGDGSRSGSVARSAINTGRTRSGENTLTKQNVEDYFQILSLLLSPAQAPLSKIFSSIADTTIRFLQLQGSTNQVHQIAFSILNTILRTTFADHISFTKSIARKTTPVISRIFEAKTLAKDAMLNSVRDEMLIFLISVHLHLESMVLDEDEAEFALKLEELLDVLRADYSRRTDRETLLQLDHLSFAENGSSPDETYPFELLSFQLRPFADGAERIWACLQVIGILEKILSARYRLADLKSRSDNGNQDDGHPRKRQRTSLTSDRLLDPLRADNQYMRVAGLHILPFVLEQCQLSAVVLSGVLAQLRQCSNDKRGDIISWALLGMASCTHQINFKEIDSADWLQMWHLGVRSLTIFPSCRAASHLLHSLLSKMPIQYHEIGEDVASIITTADVSGPAVLCDSSMLLMIHLLHLRVTEVPGASLKASQHVIRWLFSRWEPVDRDIGAHNSSHIEPHHIENLIRTCLGLEQITRSPGIKSPCRPIVQAWKAAMDNQEMIRYLLLLSLDFQNEKRRTCSSCPKFSNPDSVVFFSNNGHFLSTRKFLLEIIEPKFSEIFQSWKSYNASRSALVTQDVYRSVVNGCITILLLMRYFSQIDLTRLEVGVLEMSQELVEVLAVARAADSKEALGLDESLLQCIRLYLPQCDSCAFNEMFQEARSLLLFLKMVAEDMDNRPITASEVVEAAAKEDKMDVDDFAGRETQSKTDIWKLSMPRQSHLLDLWSGSFYRAVAGKLVLVAAFNAVPDTNGSIPSAFIEYIISLDDKGILPSRSLLREILLSDMSLDETDAIKLIARLAKILQKGEFSRCEITLCTCIDVLFGLQSFWFSAATNTLADAASQIYSYIITAALPAGLASPEVQKKLADLLFPLLKANKDYGTTISMPSPQSSLYDILQNSNASVKFHIGNQIPKMFNWLMLKDHEAAFVDILSILPSDPEWIEGIHFRLFTLAKLASSWPTLLRRCIYHIFETPPKIPQCREHATQCLKDVSTTLKLEKPQELFGLFAPQILYTWLSNEDFQDIPFQIFGFSSLQDIVNYAQEEMIALLVMRGQEKSIEKLALILDTDVSSLLQECFTKVMAYTVATDISSASSKTSNGHITGETRVKRRLGQDLFFECINFHFADILALIFNLIDCEGTVERYFMKAEDLRYAARVMEEIKAFGFADTKLPPNQQPFFKAKYLTFEIQHLCSRTQHETSSLYSDALVTSIARKLLDSVHPALGSLHACSVMRKLRILISLAGKTATQGYPLEMLLQAIRPFITEPECADDAIGMVQYLLDAGSMYLLQVPSFVAGIALAILGSLRTISNADKASTTQESQYKNTLSKAQSFHTWISQYLTNYHSPALSETTDFEALIQSALGAQAIGNAHINTAESNLLLHLLQDEGMGGSLLNGPSRELALQNLNSRFQTPTSFREDLFGDEERSIAYSAVVWKSCRQSSSKEYQAWAARVIGRAFAASGEVHGEFLQESSLSQTSQLLASTDDKDYSGAYSKACAIKLLREQTLGHDPKMVGLAEIALRIIVTASDETLGAICQMHLPAALLHASSWMSYQVPPSDMSGDMTASLESENVWNVDSINRDNWLKEFSAQIAQLVPEDPILRALLPVLRLVPGFADRAFPFVLHLALSAPHQDHPDKLSRAFRAWLAKAKPSNKNNIKMLLNSIIYLRTRPLKGESSAADRSHWLEIDYMKAGLAASNCGMFKTALLFIEEFCSQPPKGSRKSSTTKESLSQADLPTELLLTIFESVDDPDMYYGVKQVANLSTILSRIEHERDGPKSLSFRGAQYDSHIRRQDPASTNDVESLVKTLDVLNLTGLSHAMSQTQQGTGMSSSSLDSMFHTARKLEQWHIPVPSTYSSNHVTMYKALQAVNTVTDRGSVSRAMNEGFESTLKNVLREDLHATELRSSLQTLAALVEMDEVLTSYGSEQFEQVLVRFRNRSQWMKVGRFEDISQILSCRGTTLSTLSQQPRLQDTINIKAIDSRIVEVESALLASTINRAHNALQESLSLATSMLDLISPCHAINVNPEVAIHLEAANALWDQGEMASSIGMMQALDNAASLKNQTIHVGRSDLLSKIGHQVSIARLEKADKILEKYLKPALTELKGNTTGSEAGQVFHQFAVFCDQQLQDPDGLEDLERLKKLSSNKAEEVKDYDKLIAKAATTGEKNKYKGYQMKAKTWLKLDQEELKRHTSNRDEFLRQCLENYLLALGACDDHDSNALRFSALWLEHSEEVLANESVSKHLKQVPSRKFAPLMNQLSSRLQNSPNSQFQQLLFALVIRICSDHPYHGMYQIYAGATSKTNEKDDSAVSRKQATRKVGSDLASIKNTGQIWASIQQVNILYCKLAAEKDDQKYRSGKKVSLKDSPYGSRLNGSFSKYHIPPPTMYIDLSPDLDYSNVPTMVKLESTIAIASGVSAPKVITAIASNGAKFKQLVKGGNDDLRQDAIMEQVFEQVSALLKSNKSTRQRNLGIRTYRVLPLTNIAGVIEFVPNTVPLHEYLMPAHERYHPKDLKGSQCRKEIGEVQTKGTEVRIQTFRSVTSRFRPVMRYFFTEKFNDPDEWFTKRLAYTRSTAAISILGHVLGLGDRHGHNILLDAQSGEVVHIDLGVAFESGRVLPVPELVPFRLTNDIVDGMGITKTEGVFRRCCEFTLEALRKEVYSIMSILDVLRYDPLYSWSMSPVRLEKLQEEQSAAPEAAKAAHINDKPKEVTNEPGEADRALTVVNKKLSKTLSVTATVNDLINQASDERNLAVLYSGWAAYA